MRDIRLEVINGAGPPAPAYDEEHEGNLFGHGALHGASA
jgi:hypothetical protein